ncbi:MAG: FecR domain-containing protein [Burkholderiales bacterium]
MRVAAILTTLALAFPAYAAEYVGQVKTAHGDVHLQRAGQSIVVTPGMGVQQSDTIRTGADGAVGVTFTDNSLLSAGPNTVLAIDRYAFNSTTHAGQFDASVHQGTVAVVSGNIVKQTPEAMRIHTPASIMGVRGTEFVVRVNDSGN